RRRRIVGDKMAGKFCRNELCGGRMPREVGERRFTLGEPARRIDLPEQSLRARLMRIGVEDEAAGLAEKSLLADKGPAGEDTRKRGDVGLGVAAIDADRVQLHGLACEIFIEAALAA